MIYDYKTVIKKRLNDEQTLRLKNIFAPKTVAVPLADARRDVCITTDGKIRSYGTVGRTEENPSGVRAYLESSDGGLSFSEHFSTGVTESCIYVPEGDCFLRVLDSAEGGTYVLRSKSGCDDPSPEKIKVSDRIYFDAFLPKSSAFGNRIWFTAQTNKSVSEMTREDEPAVRGGFFYSDDFGKSWNEVALPDVPVLPMTYPDEGERWKRHCGCEPTAEELDENTMAVLLRNGSDTFYISYSHDRGEHWSDPEPSPFYGHDTTAFLLRLSDGRILALWNNTQILPEQRHDIQTPPQPECIVNGEWEDVFTNRDAAHAAISDDCGKTWHGFREILLNEQRNRSDYRACGGITDGCDKSVHQFQAWELPYSKVLVAAGQNPSVRRILIFDPDWLYETSRRECFLDGLENVSTHLYYRSISGGHTPLDNGHCAWNRVSGAIMAPDPEGIIKECVNISHYKDSRLVTDTQGITWNFPACRKGAAEAEIMIADGVARFHLCDRWFNCCDDSIHVFSDYTFDVNANDTGKGFVVIRIEYDADCRYAEVYCDGKKMFRAERKNPIPSGLSYLVLQCVSDRECEGIYVRRLENKCRE